MSVIAYDKTSHVPVANPDDRPSREEAEEAVRTLLKWAGDDPTREGLLDTPKRVTKAFEEWFAGYRENPDAVLARTFEEVEGYDDIVVMKDIRLESSFVPAYGAHHWQSACRLSAGRKSCWHFQAGAAC